jgi:RNA polymerase sigma factor (sigma-70 family)
MTMAVTTPMTEPDNPEPGPERDNRVAVFEEHKHLLFGVAYRMLGSVADAQDVVQDTWLRWSAAGRSDVEAPRAYLARIVINTALNRLRSAKAQREWYVGPWLPEPLLVSPHIAENVEAAESVSMAVIVVLETLTPLERAVFVLREVFGYEYGEIAASLGRSDAGVRQLAHRARGYEVAIADVNGSAGIVGFDAGKPAVTLTFEIADGHVRGLYLVNNPDKLSALAGGIELRR